MNENTTATIAKLTAKGLETMTSVAKLEVSFFDDGISVGSGTWGDCFTSDMGHRSSGVINQLAKLGLFNVNHDEDENSTWFSLTELGVEVCQALTAEEAEEAPVEILAPVGFSAKKGAKWTYLYAADGSLIAEVRNDQYDLVIVALLAKQD